MHTPRKDTQQQQQTINETHTRNNIKQATTTNVQQQTRTRNTNKKQTNQTKSSNKQQTKRIKQTTTNIAEHKPTHEQNTAKTPISPPRK